MKKEYQKKLYKVVYGKLDSSGDDYENIDNVKVVAENVEDAISQVTIGKKEYIQEVILVDWIDIS